MSEPRSFYNIMSKVSGLREDVLKDIARQVVENNKLLNACLLHDFIELPVEDDKRPWNTKYQCTQCHGTVDHREHLWYCRGREHGRQESEATP